MLFMVIEHYRPGCAEKIYARFAEKGRLCPPAVSVEASWVEPSFERCFQVMHAESEAALAPWIEAWIEAWSDLVEFEVISVVTSAEAVRRMASRGDAAP